MIEKLNSILLECHEVFIPLKMAEISKSKSR